MGTDGRSIYGYRIVGIQPTTNRWQPRCCIGGIELDRWSIDSRGNGEHGTDPIAHGIGSDCGWMLLDHPELCDQCIQSLCDFTSWHCSNDSVSYMGLQNNYESMETKMMDQLLGTAWWSIMCIVSGFAMGIYLRPWIMNKLGR